MSPVALLLWACLAADLGPSQPAGVLTLNQAVSEAEIRSPAAIRARLVFEAAAKQADLTRPRIHPDLTFRADAGANAPSVRDPAPPHAIVRRDVTAQAEVTGRQVLWHAGRKGLERRAIAATAAAAADWQAAVARLRKDIADAYYDLLAARAGFSVADEGVKLAESQLERVNDLISRQKVAEVDRLNAEAGVLEARSARVEAASGLDLAQANLNRLLGREDLGQPVSPEPVTELPPALPPLAEAVAWAQAHRPEVTALEQRQREAEAALAFARADKFPTLSLTGRTAARLPSAFEPGTEASLGIEFSWPISRMDDAPSRQAAEADAGAKQAAIGLTELRAGVAMEVRKAYRDTESARERLALAEARSAATTEAHRVRLLQYERGRATLLEIQDALVARRRAELDRLRALYDLHKAGAAFALATGRNLGDWAPAPAKETSHAPD